MWLIKNGTVFEKGKTKQILLLSGMLAPKESLYPLVRYLRNGQTEYGVTVIPLGLSISSFDTLVDGAVEFVSANLSQKDPPQTIILFGHSHGGRVANALAPRLKKLYPSTSFIIITAGTPLTKKPDYLPWYQKAFFNISSASREWPAIIQPDSSIVTKSIGYYSTNDRLVIPEFARAGYAGELIELHGLSHRDLIAPDKIGSHLLDILALCGQR